MFTKTYQQFFFATGHAEGATPLNAFDGALLASGIGNTNLIKISSILPPQLPADGLPPTYGTGKAHSGRLWFHLQ